MANVTTTGLGTVPQLLFTALSADLSTSFATSVQLDTHGAEYMGFIIAYTKGGEAGVTMQLQAQLSDTDEWVYMPITPTSVVTADAANATRAIQVFLGRDVKSIRIQSKLTSGTANATTKIQVWGMLSAPTLPMIGTVL